MEIFDVALLQPLSPSQMCGQGSTSSDLDEDPLGPDSDTPGPVEGGGGVESTNLVWQQPSHFEVPECSGSGARLLRQVRSQARPVMELIDAAAERIRLLGFYCIAGQRLQKTTGASAVHNKGPDLLPLLRVFHDRPTEARFAAETAGAARRGLVSGLLLHLAGVALQWRQVVQPDYQSLLASICQSTTRYQVMTRL